MKEYTVEIEIDLPRDRVIELFDNPDNLFKWQNGLKSFEHLSGTPGQPGAKSKLVFLNGRTTIELIETVTERKLPDEFNGTYEWSGGKNTLRNRFIELVPNRTKWESTCAYQFSNPPAETDGLAGPRHVPQAEPEVPAEFQSVCRRRSDRECRLKSLNTQREQ